MEIISKVFAWIMAYQTLPTAAEQVESVLAGFTGMVEKLDAAIDQAVAEVEASFDREEDAWTAAEAVTEIEQQARDGIMRAEHKARRARSYIAALIGE